MCLGFLQLTITNHFTSLVELSSFSRFFFFFFGLDTSEPLLTATKFSALSPPLIDTYFSLSFTSLTSSSVRTSYIGDESGPRLFGEREI